MILWHIRISSLDLRYHRTDFLIMKSRFFFPLGLICVLLVFGSCQSVDLSFVNQVKRFGPQWMVLSEKLSFIERNLSITERRYLKDLESVNGRLRRYQPAESSAVYGNINRYRSTIAERDKIKTQFEADKKAFVEKVQAFNAWENKLMKHKLDMDSANQSFETYQEDYQTLFKSIDALQQSTIENIEQHNLILRSLTRDLGMFENFDIEIQ